MTFEPDKNAIGTICFITYNRGNILLKTIKKLLPNLSSQWPVLVVDNASVKYKEDYQEIERLADSSRALFYFRHKENGLVQGNLLSLFDLARTQFFMVVSDEDYPSIESLDAMAPFLRENIDIGAIHTSLGTLPDTPGIQAHQLTDLLYNKGEGISRFGLLGNYITGQIYNGPLLKQLTVPQRLKQNVYANRYYPHLYLNILAGANTKTFISSSLACYQGKVVDYSTEDTQRDSPLDYFGTFSYGTRIDQFIALRNALFEGYQDICKSDPKNRLDMVGFYNSYIQLCAKYQYLILLANGNTYRDEVINLDLLSKSFSLFCISALEKFFDFERFKDKIANQILKSADYYLEQRLQYDKSVLPTNIENQLSDKISKFA